MHTLSLILWAISLALIPYAILRRKQVLLYVVVVAFSFLSIDVLIGLNTPNPDRIILVEVAVP